MITLNVNHLENAEIFWQTLGLENELALNEAIAPAKQTLAISVDILDEIHEKLLELNIPTSLISAAIDGKFLFSFDEPEGNTIILIGEWVEAPYTAEKRAAYFDNIKKLVVLAPEDLTDLSKDALLYFGRVTCPWCRRFSRQLAKIDQKIYYINTEDTDIQPQLQTLRQQYDVPTVPTLIKRFADGTFVKFDEKTQTVAEFVNSL